MVLRSKKVHNTHEGIQGIAIECQISSHVRLDAVNVGVMDFADILDTVGGQIVWYIAEFPQLLPAIETKAKIELIDVSSKVFKPEIFSPSALAASENDIIIMENDSPSREIVLLEARNDQ